MAHALCAFRMSTEALFPRTLQPVSVVISTCGSSFDTVIGVYMDLGQYNFALISSNDDSEECGSGQQSQLEVILQPETDYLIVLVRTKQSCCRPQQTTGFRVLTVDVT